MDLVPQNSCCLCNYLGSSESDLENHIDNHHQKIFRLSETQDKENRVNVTIKIENQEPEMETETEDQGHPVNLESISAMELPINATSKPEIDLEPPLKKIKIKCCYCLKAYRNLECLRSHVTIKHKDEDVPQTFASRLNQVEVTQKHEAKKVEAIEKKVLFLENIGIAVTAEKEAYYIDKAKANMVRMGGFNFKSRLTPQKSDYKSVVKDVIDEIVPHLKFSIMNAKPYQKNKDILIVSFEHRFQAATVFSALRYSRKLTGNQFIERMTSAETKIRFSILEVLAAKVKQNYKKKYPRVDYIAMKPYLFLRKKSGEQKLQFTDALKEYGSLLKPEDLPEAKRIAIAHSINGRDLLQFVIKFK